MGRQLARAFVLLDHVCFAIARIRRRLQKHRQFKVHPANGCVGAPAAEHNRESQPSDALQKERAAPSCACELGQDPAQHTTNTR